jgi:hypothetical protein
MPGPAALGARLAQVLALDQDVRRPATVYDISKPIYARTGLERPRSR